MTLEMIGTQSIHPDYSNLHNITVRQNPVLAFSFVVTAMIPLILVVVCISTSVIIALRR